MPALRRSKFSIPAIDPNPRPPNEATAPPTTPAAQMAGAMTRNVAKGGPVYDPPATSAQSGLTAATVGGSIQTASSALGLTSYSPTQGQPDPRDAEYWRNLNNLLFNTQGKIRGLNLAGSRAELDRGRDTFDLNASRKRGQRSLGESAISQGLANSGWLARNEAEDSSDYLRDYEDMQTGYDRAGADRTTQINQAIQDYIAGEGDLMGTALGRYLGSQTTAGQTGAPENKPGDAASAAASKPQFYVDTTTNPPSVVSVDKQGGEFYVDTTQHTPKPKPSTYKPKKRK